MDPITAPPSRPLGRALAAWGALAVTTLLATPVARAQYPAGTGRFTLWGMTGRRSYSDGTAGTSYGEVTGALQLRSGDREEGGFEWGLDARASAYPGTEGRESRTSVYEAWVGGTTRGGLFNVKAGQLWINDLGGIGSVGGVAVEFRPKKKGKDGKRQRRGFRLGLFAGVEPKGYETGYVSGVKKAGAYVSYDGDGAQRSTLGWVTVRNGDLTERSVVSMTNFLPIGKTVYVYQALEYDLVAPAGQGSAAGLTYFFVNGRWSPTRIVDVQATYHRGRSIDSRTITDDVRNGRPVDSRSLDGFLYESYGGRVTVEVIPRLRLWAGYTQDRDNRDDRAYGRVGAGLWAANVLGTGLDVSASDNRVDRSTGSYDSWYFSIGRSIGPRCYVTFDYSTSLSALSFVGPDGIVVQSRPKTRRFGLSGNANLSRHFSLMLTAEQLDDDSSKDVRVLTGVTYRF